MVEEISFQLDGGGGGGGGGRGDRSSLVKLVGRIKLRDPGDRLDEDQVSKSSRWGQEGGGG